MKPLQTLLLSVALSLGCSLQPKNIPDHTLYADDGQKVAVTGELTFAVVGNLRRAVPVVDGLGGRDVEDDAPQAIALDLENRARGRELDFVALLGDFTRWSRDKEWLAFDDSWRDVLDGETLPSSESYRMPAVPVAGDHDAMFDKSLQGFEGAFPGVGADIGYNRVGSWYAFDVAVSTDTWRFVVLDTNKKKLGSRWQEQLFWIPKAVKGRYDHLVVFMHEPRITLADGVEMNQDGVPLELLEAVEDHAGLLKLRAVFAAGSHTTELYLPEGRLGAAYFVAGGGGARAEELQRWGDGRPAGLEGNIQLEPLFDVALQRAVEKRAADEGWPDKVVEKAQASGDWEGFTGAYDPEYLPLYGYWEVHVTGDAMYALFRAVQPGGRAEQLYRVDYVAGKGWASAG